MSYTVTLGCGCRVYVACHPRTGLAHTRIIEYLSTGCAVRSHAIGVRVPVWELLPYEPDEPSPVVLDELLMRVQGEFLEMPGLRLTRAQAQRLWALDAVACEAVLSALVDARFLVEARNASFMRASSSDRA